MKILHFDIIEGFKKGSITQFENDNLNETYKIYLYKNKMRFDVDGKTIRFVMLDKNKAGQVLTLKKGEASNEIILPVTKELTKNDGTYDAQIIFTKEDGYNEKTIPFRVTIKNDLLTDMESELVSREEYQYLVDRFEEAVRNIENFKVEIRNEYSGMETDLNDKYILFKDEVNNSNNSFKDEINSQVTKNTKEIDDAKGEYDTLKARLDRENEKVYGTINNKDFLPFEGENVTVEHSKVGFTKDMIIEGRTYQNLIGKFYPGYGCVLNEDVYTITGVANNWSLLTFDPKFILNSGKTYTVVMNVLENTISSTLFKLEAFSGGTWVQAKTVSGTGIVALTFNHSSLNISTFKLQIQNAEGSILKISNKILILEGELNYIPPYFEGIKSVAEEDGNKISILSTGKNLFNLKSFTSNNNTTIEYIENGYILTGNGDWKSLSYKFKLVPNKKYYLKFNRKWLEGDKGTSLVIKDDGNNIVDDNQENGRYGLSEYSFTPKTSNITIIIFSSRANASKTEVTNIILSESDIQYEPRQEDKKEILLPFEDGLKGLPNGVCDTIENREDGIYFVKRICKKVLDSRDDWVLRGDVNLTNGKIFGVYIDEKYKPGTDFINNTFMSSRDMVSDSQFVRVTHDPSLGKSYVAIGVFNIQSVEEFKTWLQKNSVEIYFAIAEPVETKLDVSSLNLETFKDTTHVLSENFISPNFKFKAAVNVPATISTLRTRNESLEQGNKELKEEVDNKTLKLHGQDVALINSDLDLDFRLFEIEMNIGLPLNLNVKGVNSMARSPFEMMKILILNNNYDREDIEYKASRYLKGGRMSQAEYNEIISLMDANEVIQ